MRKGKLRETMAALPIFFFLMLPLFFLSSAIFFLFVWIVPQNGSVEPTPKRKCYIFKKNTTTRNDEGSIGQSRIYTYTSIERVYIFFVFLGSLFETRAVDYFTI